MTYLCVPIFATSLEQARRDALLAAEHGAELIEYRIDTFGDADALESLLKDSPVPCVVTCRSAAEGGRGELSDEERIARLDSPGTQWARYVDVELDTYRKMSSPAAV